MTWVATGAELGSSKTTSNWTKGYVTEGFVTGCWEEALDKLCGIWRIGTETGWVRGSVNKGVVTVGSEETGSAIGGTVASKSTILGAWTGLHCSLVGLGG